MVWEKQWENFFSSGKGNQYPDSSVIRFVANNYYNADQRQKIKILDLGCGAGGNTWYLSREGFNVYAVDGSLSSVNNTAKKIKSESLNADVRVSDFSELPFGDEFFDAVIDSASIQHNDDESIRDIVNEVYRVIRSGGKFFGIMINSDKNLSAKNYYTQFTDDEYVADVFRKFSDIELNFNMYTENNKKDYIKFTLITATKI